MNFAQRTHQLYFRMAGEKVLDLAAVQALLPGGSSTEHHAPASGELVGVQAWNLRAKAAGCKRRLPASESHAHEAFSMEAGLVWVQGS